MASAGPDAASLAGRPGRTRYNPTANAVQRTRAWTGLLVVVFGDVAIAIAAIWGVFKVSGSSADRSQIVAVLTSAFTAIGTTTTAYFGIRAATNTAQSAVAANTPPPVAEPPPRGPDGAPPNGGAGGPPPPVVADAEPTPVADEPAQAGGTGPAAVPDEPAQDGDGDPGGPLLAPQHTQPEGAGLSWKKEDFGPADYVGDADVEGSTELVADGSQEAED